MFSCIFGNNSIIYLQIRSLNSMSYFNLSITVPLASLLRMKSVIFELQNMTNKCCSTFFDCDRYMSKRTIQVFGRNQITTQTIRPAFVVFRCVPCTSQLIQQIDLSTELAKTLLSDLISNHRAIHAPSLPPKHHQQAPPIRAALKMRFESTEKRIDTSRPLAKVSADISHTGVGLDRNTTDLRRLIRCAPFNPSLLTAWPS